MSSSKEVSSSSWPLSTRSTLLLIGAGGAIGVGAFIYKQLNAPNSSDGGTFDEMFKPTVRSESEQPVGPSTGVKEWKFARHAPAPGTIPVLILFGTEYGCSQEVAMKLEEQIYSLEGGKYFPRVVDMEDYKLLDIEKEQIILVVTSTYGDGVPPTRAREFFDFIEANPQKLSGIQFSVLGLGDSAYPYFCRAAKTIDRLFEEFGANRFYKKSEVDCEDWGVIDRWCDAVIERIPKLTLSPKEDYLWPRVSEYKEKDTWSRKRPFFANLVIKDILTQQMDKDDKETIHFEFDLADSGITYVVGDSLGVLPTNDPSHVDHLLKIIKLDPKTMTNLPSWKYEVKSIPAGKQGPIREVLLYFYDLKNVKPKLLQLLLTEGEKQKKTEKVNRLKKLLEKGTSKENTILSDYVYGREAIDVLEEYSDIQVPLNDLLAALGQLLPRYYSISSSQVHDPTKVTITVAAVRYVAHSKSREGVTSTYLADDVSVGHKVPIFVNNNPDFRLPSDPTTPILMIGPGTGVAPFRAMLQERIKTNATGSNTLYFGCRMSTRDFLYKEELENLQDKKQLLLHTAFSRDQDKKVYVQHKLAGNAEEVWNLIQNGGHVYVCGDAQYMEKDVYQTLVEIASNYGNMKKDEAEDYIKKLEHAKRYQKDTWF